MCIFQAWRGRTFKKRGHSVSSQSCLATNDPLINYRDSKLNIVQYYTVALCLPAPILRILEQSLNLILVILQAHFPYFDGPNGRRVELVCDMLVSKACSGLCFPLDFSFSGLSYCQDPRKQFKRDYLFGMMGVYIDNGQRIYGYRSVPLSCFLAHAI